MIAMFNDAVDDEDVADDASASSSLLEIKLVIASATFVISLVSAFSPMQVITLDDNIFSVGNMLASGVLFAAGLVHQLPDATELFKTSGIITSNFPIASFIAGLTFTFFLILEEYVHTQFDDIINNTNTVHQEDNDAQQQQQRQQQHEKEKLLHHQPRSDSCCAAGKKKQAYTDEYTTLLPTNTAATTTRNNDTKHDERSIVAVAVTSTVACLLSNDGNICKDDACRTRCSVYLCSSNVNCTDVGCRNRKRTSCGCTNDRIGARTRNRSISLGSSNFGGDVLPGKESDGNGNANKTTTDNNDNPSDDNTVSSHHSHIMHELKTRKQKQHEHNRVRSSGTATMSDVLDSMRDYHFSHEHPIHYQEEHLADHAQTGLLSSILLLIALSFHSFIEQVAIGMATTPNELTSTSAAVLAHKAFAGYALGSALVASHMKRYHIIVLIFVFSLCSIIGVFIGILIQHLTATSIENNNTNYSNIPIGIVQAMVTGTFLYVSIVEIAMKELMTHRDSSRSSNNTVSDGGGTSTETWQIRKLVAFLIGYTIMALLAIWV